MLVEMLAAKLAVKDEVPKTIDLLAIVAHGMANIGILSKPDNRLTHGASAVTRKAVEIRVSHEEIKMTCFGAYRNSVDPGFEIFAKKYFLRNAVSVGLVLTTLEEALKIRNAWYQQFPDVSPKTVVVVTDEAHSIRCKMIWKAIFPDSDVRVITVPIASTKDWYSPMWPYWFMWITLIFQVGPYPYSKWVVSGGEVRMQKYATRHSQPSRRRK